MEFIKIVVGQELLNGFVKDGIVYAPVKRIAGIFNAKTLWSAAERKITIIKGGQND